MSDTISMLLTYGIVYVVIIGGGVILVSGRVTDQLVVGAIIGFMGSALTFVTQKEVQKQTARQQERALLTTPPNGYSVTASQPISATITPEPATETEA